LLRDSQLSARVDVPVGQQRTAAINSRPPSQKQRQQYSTHIKVRALDFRAVVVDVGVVG